MKVKLKPMPIDFTPIKTPKRRHRLNTSLYAELQGLQGTNEAAELDVFEFPEEQASTLFVNPFLCPGCLPCDYEKLNKIVQNSNEDPEDLLRRNGVSPLQGAISYVTSKQAEILLAELASIGPVPDTIASEACAYYISSCLNRARRANSRFQ